MYITHTHHTSHYTLQLYANQSNALQTRVHTQSIKSQTLTKHVPTTVTELHVNRTSTPRPASLTHGTRTPTAPSNNGRTKVARRGVHTLQYSTTPIATKGATRRLVLAASRHPRLSKAASTRRRSHLVWSPQHSCIDHLPVRRHLSIYPPSYPGQYVRRLSLCSVVGSADL